MECKVNKKVIGVQYRFLTIGLMKSEQRVRSGSLYDGASGCGCNLQI